MFIEYIERLRERPHAARRRVAFISAGAATAVVGLLWALTLPATLGSLAVRIDDLSANVGAADLSDAVKANSAGLQQFIDAKETLQESMAPSAAEIMPSGYEAEQPFVSPTPSSVSTGGSVIIATSSSERRE